MICTNDRLVQRRFLRVLDLHSATFLLQTAAHATVVGTWLYGAARGSKGWRMAARPSTAMGSVYV